MKIIQDDQVINHYIAMHKLYDYFEIDMKSHMSLCYYDKGENILTSGDIMHYFYFVVEGKVKIFNRLENGKSVLLRIPEALTELGSVEVVLKNKIVDSFVESLHGTYVIRIPFKALDEYAPHDGKFYRYIVKQLSHKLTTLSNTAALNTTYPFRNRFASYLISISALSESEFIDEIKIEQFTDLATFLGTSYRHFNRVVKEFIDEGIILKNKKSFTILDHEKLEALSGGFYE